MSGTKIIDSNIIEARDLHCGQVAIMVDGVYHGRVVQRFKNFLITINQNEGMSWNNCASVTHRVKILPPGTRLEIL